MRARRRDGAGDASDDWDDRAMWGGDIARGGARREA
jgi:hypothetical protein